ncbi:hypothetical protein LTR37_016728 [Vermiconidia calcicola]|uniref:Uncharacterized protein n=1 Tax=Vermiconidia calcicola TaxID=1690605 RepID=A0ACC3MMU2_9PEZI|nr:hypothetical protein LTR37_016728 [Vermiconidia calcicola]
MDDNSKDQVAGATERQEHEEPQITQEHEEASHKPATLKNKSKCKKHERCSRKHVKKASGSKARKEKSESDESSEDESEDTDSSDSSSADDTAKRRKAKKASKAKKEKRAPRKSKKPVEDSDSDEQSDASDSDGESSASESDESPVDTTAASMKALELQVADLKRQMTAGKKQKAKKPTRTRQKSPKSKSKSSKQSFSSQFRRVDQLWDSTIHNYRLKESAEDDDSEFAEYAFLVRRTFDWENKYRDTVVDIKSKQLRDALAVVMKDCKSVSLEAEEPTIDPNVLFLYLEELRTYYKKTMKTKIKAEKKRKLAKKLEQQRSLLKTLVKYIDEDYADTKKTLYPLLKAGNITFELLWALFKPNDVAVTACYGSWDEPRCFKVDYANKCASMTRGEWYCVEGRYLEYDGKDFGFGDFEVDVEGFKGPRKITSLATYPLKYHQDPDRVKKQIIERGERFVNMEGMHYKFHKGMAFMKKKKQILRININGRVMIDPSTFRRVNPNYPISVIKANDDEDLFSLSDDDESDEDDCCCGSGSEDEEPSGGRELEKKGDDDQPPKYKYKWGKDGRGRNTFLAVEVDADGDPIIPQHVDKLTERADTGKRSFTEDELLLTTPVMLGFAFSEKLWLEFTISGVHDIVYNDAAFDSLVLPPNQKSIVRALVESHKFHAARTIDDVVQGKGKGLVAVLHGPPGTGKTLTAEGISELLRCPLYMVSAGELGTDPARLEHELQKILDIAHSWGAVLLLDEADVFLEKREVHDIHRNALVSIFLRLLEYFQGILFLTTNRVETFDDAFQSRIHVALRYGELTAKAKKTVWKMFLDLVRKVDGMEVADISDYELDILSRNQLNGRQIKNLVRTAQALALNEKEKLTMEHIKRVIDVVEAFDHDLKGGTGYIDAMRSYT